MYILKDGTQTVFIIIIHAQYQKAMDKVKINNTVVHIDKGIEPNIVTWPKTSSKHNMRANILERTLT